MKKNKLVKSSKTVLTINSVEEWIDHLDPRTLDVSGATFNQAEISMQLLTLINFDNDAC